MKKVLIAGLFFLSLIGCSNIKNDEDYNLYDKYIKELSLINNGSYIPASIDVKLEKLSIKKYIYIVTIDNPEEELKNIEAIAIHNFKTDSIFPSSGIFDNKLNLIPQTVDHDMNVVKGIILIGYIEAEKIDNIEFKILINTENAKYYYVKEIDNF